MEMTELTGEALAAEVATKVMGWTLEHGCWCDKPHNDAYGEWEYPTVAVCAFRPDLNITQAWKVVDKVREGSEWNRFLYALPRFSQDGNALDALQWLFFECDQDELCEAICRAALAAMEARCES